MSALRLELGAYAAAVRERIDSLRAEGFPRRLADGDDSLWGEDAARRRVVASRLGWLASPAAMLERSEELTAFARAAREDGFQRVLLLGMGEIGRAHV